MWWKHSWKHGDRVGLTMDSTLGQTRAKLMTVMPVHSSSNSTNSVLSHQGTLAIMQVLCLVQDIVCTACGV